MNKDRSIEDGIQSLVERYRDAFRIPENLDHYAEEDFKSAEKQFIRYALDHCRLDLLLRAQ